MAEVLPDQKAAVVKRLQADLDVWLVEYNAALQHPSVYTIEVNKSC